MATLSKLLTPSSKKLVMKWEKSKGYFVIMKSIGDTSMTMELYGIAMLT